MENAFKATPLVLNIIIILEGEIGLRVFDIFLFKPLHER